MGIPVEAGTRPFFSVVVPMFRAEGTLRETIESLKGQSFRDWEAVFVDDGSPDASARIVEDAAHGDPRLHLLRHSRNRGTHAARKTGVAATQGRWILFLDPDDTFASEAFTSLAERLRETPAQIARFGFSPMDLRRCSSDMLAALNAPRLRDGLVREGPGAALPEFFHGRNVPLFIWTLVIRSEPAKAAFAAMEDIHLTYAEDIYETFCIAAYCDGYAEFRIDAYRYRLGVGGTTAWRHALPADPATWIDGFERTASLRAASFAALRRFAKSDASVPAETRDAVRRASRAERRRLLIGGFPWELSTARAVGCPRDRLGACLRALLKPLSARDRVLLQGAWRLRSALERCGLLVHPAQRTR